MDKLRPKHIVASIVVIGVVTAAIVLRVPNILWGLFIAVFIVNND
jgi:hypothetical protein